MKSLLVLLFPNDRTAANCAAREMSLTKFIVVALVLCVLVIFIAATIQGRKHVVTALQVYKESNGQFDAPAIEALRIATGPNATPDDHLLAATILRRNVPPQAGARTPQHERKRVNQIRNHYLAALRAPQGRGTVNRGFIVDAMLDFAQGVNENDEVIARLLTDDLRQMDAKTPNGVRIEIMVHPHLVQEANKARDELIRDRKQTASAQSTPAAATNAYLKMATSHTDDPENVHDSSVNGCLRGIVGRLRDDQGTQLLPSLDAITSEIKAGAEFREKADRIPGVIYVIDVCRECSMCIAANITDCEALQRVWLRADDERNKNVRNQIREAVFDALFDCYRPNSVWRKCVCTNGRVSRILGALATLDFDSRNSMLSTTEQLKNDLFAATGREITEQAQIAAKSADLELRKAGQSRLAKSMEELEALGPVSPRGEETFLATTRKAVSAMLDKEIARINALTDGSIPPTLVDGIKKEALAAVS